MAEFRMPSLGADMDEGTLLEWRVAPGDAVHPGDIVAVVDTAKSAVEVESFTSGVVSSLLVDPGTTVPVGTPLAMFSEAVPAGGPPPLAPPTPTPVTPAPVTPVTVTPAPVTPVAVGPVAVSPERRVRSPLARHRAAELGVDLDRVAGTGPHGEVTRVDVERAAAAAPPAPAVARRAAGPAPRGRVTPFARRLAEQLGVDLAPMLTGDGTRTVRAADIRAAAAGAATARTAPAPEQPPAPAAPTPAAVPTVAAPGRRDRRADMRQAIARLMSRANREIPHYYLTTTVDMSTPLAWMHERNRELDMAERLVPAALLLKAVALAARRHPALNGHWVDDAFHPADSVHLGVAVSLRGGGLVAPALRDAQDLSLTELMVRMKDLVERARAGTLRGSELSDPTITVTNLGDQGVESVHGVIYPPQVALVGAGRVTEQPRAVGGLLGIRPCLTLTLAADHRATDGYTGGRFLTEVDRLLQNPEGL